MWPCDTDDDDYDNLSSTANGFLDVSGLRLDDTLLHQAYVLIGQSKCTGLSQLELANKLGLTKLNARTVIRNLGKLNLISSYLKDVGRQRTSW